MAGALRKTMLYLGLADDRGEEIEDQFEEYDDYDEVGSDVTPEYEAQVTPINRSVSRQAPVAAAAPAELRRITTVHPRVIGEAFRAGTPVIINLSDMDDADAKRLVDFSAGLIFGLRGAIERVTNKVFLLSPEHVEVSGQDHTVEKSAGRPGFYNQS